MRDRRELLLAAALVVLLGCGLIYEALADEVEIADVPADAGPRFVARASFCPPSVKKENVATYFSVFSASGEPASVNLEPEDNPPQELASEGVIVRRAGDGGARDVVGFGASVGASAFTRVLDPVPGAGAAACTDHAATQWFFPSGSTGLGFDERLLIYNPFPDEAVVSVTGFTSGGTITRSRLADVAVPAREAVGVALNDFIVRHRFLAVAVTAHRGRVVAWRTLLANPRSRPEGVQSSLGATSPAEEWYLPDGGVGSGFDERIALLNPSGREAVVTVSLVTNEELVQPPRLLDFPLPARSARSISLADNVRGKDAELGFAGAIVHSTNGVEIVVERTVWYSRADLAGVASELGATEAATSWAVGPAGIAADSDVLVLMNAGAADASADVSFLRDHGPPIAPGDLQGVAVPSGSRIRLPVREWTHGRAMVALVESSEPIVAERFAYTDAVSDVAALLGLPLTPSAQP